MSSDSSADWIFSTNTMFGAAGFTSGVFFGAACSGTEAQAEKQQNRIPAAKTDIFVFTYFDVPTADDDGNIPVNQFEIQGRICKIDPIQKKKNGKHNIHFILANNIHSGDGKQKINNYIPIVCWGNLAKEVQNYHVSDVLTVRGQLHSRTYKKVHEDGEVEILMAHEGVGLEVSPIAITLADNG